MYLSLNAQETTQFFTISNAYNIGDMLDSLDTRNLWLEAVVINMKDDMILIHYPQWSSKWDVWVHCDGETIAPHRTHTTGPNFNPNYRIESL